MTLNTAFVVIEVIYGLYAHSLALVADAGHNLGDVFGLLLAWGAAIWTNRAATSHHTYGWRRSSVLAALANAVFLLVSMGVVAWEAIRSLRQPPAIEAHTIIWVAATGIAVNGFTALMFMSGRKGDLNIRAAFQHMLGDAIVSAGVVVAGILILYTGWLWLDPVVSLALVGIVVAGTWGLLRDSLDLALDAVPAAIDEAAVQAYLCSLPSVADVHHLHIWGLSTTEVALTAHLVVRSDHIDNALLGEIDQTLAEKFGIGHATIQLESPGEPGCARRACAGTAKAPHVHI